MTNYTTYYLAMLEALTILGYGTSYNAREMLRRNHTRFCAEGLQAKYEGGHPFGLEQFESLWGDYRTISGEPAYIFAKECLELYPEAKVILTMRDDEKNWLRSVSDTMWYRHGLLTTKFLPYVDNVFANMTAFTLPYWKHLFWDDVPNQGIRVYREHNAMVQRLAAGRLLVYNAKEGWEPLCKFLGKEIPSVDFPHVNKTDEHRLIFCNASRQALIAFAKRLIFKGGLPIVILGLILWRRRFQTLLASLRR